MIDQLISTFCRIDDFCIIYHKELQSKSIDYKKKKAGLKPSLSLREIMIILTMYQAIRYKDFKTYYVEFIKIYWKHYFPTAPSYNRFVELIDMRVHRGLSKEMKKKVVDYFAINNHKKY